MELLTVFNAKNNVMLVHRPQIFVYHVTELIGFHGLHLIMIANVLMVISIMVLLTVFNAKINVMHVLYNQIFAYLVTELIELLGL